MALERQCEALAASGRQMERRVEVFAVVCELVRACACGPKKKEWKNRNMKILE